MSVTAWIIALNPENPVALELQRTLNEQGIDATIRQAVDGRQKMPELQGQEQLSQKKAMSYRRAPLTSSEVGCYLSHYRLIREAYDSGLSHICLFEDDVVAEDGVGELIRGITQLGDKHHLVRLMSLKIRKRKVLESLPGGYTLVRPLRGALGTQGYVVNRAGMKRILDFGKLIYLTIDKLYDSFFLYGLHCFSVEPHAVYELVRPTNVIKVAVQNDANFATQVAWHWNKFHRSYMRRIDFLLGVEGYLPASRPRVKSGRSERIR